MCPAERQGVEENAPPADETPAAGAVDTTADEPEAAADPLAAFAVEAARRQAVERGEEEASVDEAFIARALGESARMRNETGKSNQKRAANLAAVAGRHGEQGLSAIQAAMAEHAAEVLAPPEQPSATGAHGDEPVS